MDNLRTKLNNLNGGLKFILRIIYPVVIYSVLFLSLINTQLVQPRIVQGLFILLWGAIEWYFFLSVKKEK
jgi:hypothetical protein